MKDLKVCVYCGLTWDEFLSIKKLGCKHCYEVFADELMYRLDCFYTQDKKGESKSGGQSAMTSEIAVPIAPSLSDSEMLLKLKRDLSFAVIQEDFKKAALIKKKITKMESGGSQVIDEI